MEVASRDGMEDSTMTRQDTAFRIVRSHIGPYWQVRARDLRSGCEDTVDRLYTSEEVEAKRLSLLAQGWLDLS